MAEDDTLPSEEETTAETAQTPPEAEAVVADAPEGDGDAPAGDAPESEAPEAEAPEPEAAESEPARSAAPPREPVEVLAPKERRRRRRAAKAPATRSPLTAQERQAERDAQRAGKAAARRGTRLKERAAKPTAAAAVPAPAPEAPVSAGRPKSRQGVVVSNKADKTITVRVDTSRRHRRYKKIVRLSKTLHAHDERNEAHEGDQVRVIETRPLSATKRWRLVEILERAK